VRGREAVSAAEEERMARYSLLVITDEVPTKGSMASLMAPYHDQWDWYQVGGRWTGLLTGYKPDEDPANIEVCDLCNGTGVRNDTVAQELRREGPTLKCHGCQGKGMRVRWWFAPYAKDSIQVKELDSKGLPPTLAVLKDGKWYERDEWWAEEAVANAKLEEWKAKFENLTANLPASAWSTIVDCHN
jgi:hypothetical protein